MACKQTQTDEENGNTRRSLSIPAFWGWIFSNGSAAKESDGGKGEGEGEGEEDDEDEEVDKGDEGRELRPLAVGWSRDTKSEYDILRFRDSGEEVGLLIPGEVR